MPETTVFLYEHITGGGMMNDDVPSPTNSLLNEGRAMITAIAEDFLRIRGVQVHLMLDSRLSIEMPPAAVVHRVAGTREFEQTLLQLAAGCQWTLLIAPEFDGILAAIARSAEATGARLLSPCSEVVADASNKRVTSEQLASHQIPVPRATSVPAGHPLPSDFCYPAVIKPVDGAGSIDVLLVETPDDGGVWHCPMRLEQFCPGIPASVAVLTGGGRSITCPAVRQLLSDDGRFTYRGGEFPLDGGLARRAEQLATAAVAALQPNIGYLGVDLVLGADPQGRDDVVIEINPRLTTSYIGLRHAVHENLAELMLHLASGKGKEFLKLSCRQHKVQFWACGRVDVSEPEGEMHEVVGF